MLGLIGKKLGMSSFFSEEGTNIPCTIIQAGPCYVTQIKNEESDGYCSVQIGYEKKKISHVNSSLKGHFLKAGLDPLCKLFELLDCEKKYSLGDVIDVTLFQKGEYVDVSAFSKGKGFQGVVKRHGFSGVGQSTHGQHNRLRAPGSIGAGSDPSRVFKGTRMAGRMGGVKNTIQNLKVLKIDKERNIIILSGSVPGYNNSYLTILK